MAKKDKPSAARAQPPDQPPEDPLDQQARTAGSVDDRVFVIAQYLVEGRWTKRRALLLHNLWAVSPATLKGYAARAAALNRMLKGADGLLATRRKVESRLDHAFEMAVASGDAKAAVAAAKTLGEIAGLFPKGTPKSVGEEAKTPGGLPPEIALYAHDERLVRLYELLKKRLTPAQVSQILAGVPPEEIAKAAGVSPGLPS